MLPFNLKEIETLFVMHLSKILVSPGFNAYFKKLEKKVGQLPQTQPRSILEDLERTEDNLEDNPEHEDGLSSRGRDETLILSLPPALALRTVLCGLC